jgi:stage II sporulation protein D
MRYRFEAASFSFLFFLLTVSCAPMAPGTEPAPMPGASPGQAVATAGANRMQRLTTPPQVPTDPIRVGLMSDQATFNFPRIGDGYIIVSDEGAHRIRRGFNVEAPVPAGQVRYGVQVSALSDLTSAEAFARRIEEATGQTVVLVFDAGPGLHRVVAGNFPSRDAATTFRAELATGGFAGTDAMIVPRPAEQEFVRAVGIVDDEGERHRLAGESILVLPSGRETVTIDNLPYRGGVRLFVNSRGLLNIINEVNLEEYVQGVVPNEMGPRVYDELEALKAQAMAARTYAIRRRGDFRTEGYDICPTAACQVYRGFSTEDPLSNQAVQQTAGRIITHNGRPIDALYTSTCGGETSDVDVMFPGRTDPYLRRVRCVELELMQLAGRANGPLLDDLQLEAQMFRGLVPALAAESWAARDVVAAVQGAARLVNAPLANVAAPASSRRGDVLRYLAGAWGLDRFDARLILPEDRAYFFPNRNADSQEARIAAAMIKFQIGPPQYIDLIDLNAPMPREELYALLGSWLRQRNYIREINGRIVGVSGREVRLKAEGQVTSYTLPAGIPLYRRVLTRAQEYRSLPVSLGDRATVIRRPDGAITAFVVQANYDGIAFDRTSSFSSWTRSFRAPELVQTIARRNPIRELQDLRPLTYDPSHRVRELEVVAEGGRTFTLRGLPIRWSLNLPDNLFVMDRSTDPDGVARYTFWGKGWGHGTGMCQVGAYGMAVRGRSVDQIIRHYYTGVEITSAAAQPASQ